MQGDLSDKSEGADSEKPVTAVESEAPKGFLDKLRGK